MKTQSEGQSDKGRDEPDKHFQILRDRQTQEQRKNNAGFFLLRTKIDTDTDTDTDTNTDTDNNGEPKQIFSDRTSLILTHY